jgi:hypothetical protein
MRAAVGLQRTGSMPGNIDAAGDGDRVVDGALRSA